MNQQQMPMTGERILKGTLDSDLESDAIADLLERGTIQLSGKDYLQVAYRVKIFRALNPNSQITTEPIVLDNTIVAMRATISLNNYILATATKTVLKGTGKSAAAKFPIEFAETGAIGRAINLCGIGSIAGDLDEGEQISEAPVAPKSSKSTVATITKNIR